MHSYEFAHVRVYRFAQCMMIQNQPTLNTNDVVSCNLKMHVMKSSTMVSNQKAWYSMLSHVINRYDIFYFEGSQPPHAIATSRRVVARTLLSHCGAFY